MRGNTPGSATPHMNLEDVCEEMRKYTDMTEDEIKGFESAHDMQLLIEQVRENGTEDKPM